MFEAIIFVLILFVFIATFIFWCCENKRDLDTRIIGGAFITYCFISVFVQAYLLPILEIIDWDKRISLQIQFTALVIGLTAAIIAFRNYQRKSGSQLLADIFVKEHENIWYVSEIMVQNCKDKATFIFAIDLITKNNRVRIKTYDKPHVLSAYQTDIIEFLPVFKYENNFELESNDITSAQIECVTEHGIISVNKLNITQTLSSCSNIRALRLDVKYLKKGISNKAEYIVEMEIYQRLNKDLANYQYLEVTIVNNYLNLVSSTDDSQIQLLEGVLITQKSLDLVHQGIDISKELNERYQTYFHQDGLILMGKMYRIIGFKKVELELTN